MTPTAKDLADWLGRQARAGPLVQLTDGSLGTGCLDHLVQTCLRRPEPILKLAVDPGQIPANPSPAGFTVHATVPAGEDGFLSLGGYQATLDFVVTGTNVDLVLTVSMGPAWVFSQSFPELAYLPYDDLALADPKQLILSTVGTPPKGLSFAGTLKLEGLFQAAADLLGISGTYSLHGPISGIRDSFALDLTASFGAGGKTIGPPGGIQVALDGDSVGAGVALSTVTSDNVTERSVEIYLGARVMVAGFPLNARIALPLASGRPAAGQMPDALMLSIFSDAGHEITLDRLGHLIGGQTWDGFFAGAAADLESLLDAFAFKGYTAVISLSPSVAIDSMTLQAGTLAGKSLQMWPDGPSLGFDIFWTLSFLGQAPDSYVFLAAEFKYPAATEEGRQPPNQLTFDLTIDSNLDIAGVEKGTIGPLSLASLNSDIFDGSLHIPDDLLVIEVRDFTFAASIGGKAKAFSIGAVASASFSLFGTSILGIRDMAIGVSFEPSQQRTSYTAAVHGEVYLGPIAFQADATISDKEGVDTVFSLHLVNETVGSMLGHVVHLVDPTLDIRLPEPWNKFLDISLDAFVLEVNLTKGSVTLDYEPAQPADLGFLTVDQMSLTYTKAADGKASSTKVEVSGSFLGVSFSTKPGSPNAPLAWDPVKESPPAVPGKGSSLFDLEYLGLGQHIALPGGTPQNMAEVMDKLVKAATPVPPGELPPLGPGGLEFSAASQWLIGAKFTVADTVGITAVFSDHPDLYGAVLELSGAKAEIFAGLRFEILYHKVTESIGVYHTELKLPDAMRHLELGAVSVTLPIVDLDIYTNGNFRVDFGFPKGQDFSRSFALQAFPFIGYGGFYFALLDGATSSRVPAITNGMFAPVVEFGIALQIGVGKTISEGALSGGVSVTVLGVLEGVLAWFHPTDTSDPETYHWIKGMIAVTGRLYGTVDFGVIQASLDVTANAIATLLIESHQPSLVAVSASVSVLVNVKIVFITIHLSFQASVDASFTIGSASPAPWRLAAGGTSSHGPLRMLAGQRTMHTPAALIHPGLARAHRKALAASNAVTGITGWSAACVLPGGRRRLAIHPLPGLTKSAEFAAATRIVLLFGAQTSVPPDAAGLAEHRDLAGADPASAPFNLLMQAMLGWGIYAKTGKAIGDDCVVTATQLEELRHQLTLPDTADALSGYQTLTAFLGANFAIAIEPRYDDTPVSMALFPVIPDLTFTDVGGRVVDFARQTMVDGAYAEKARAYYGLLRQRFDAERANGAAAPDAAQAAGGDGPQSMATLLFRQYFPMLMAAGVKAAADYLAAVPYTTPAAMSIAQVGRAIGDAALRDEPLRVVTPNQDRPVLAADALIDLPDVVRQVRSGETVIRIASSLAQAGAGAPEGAWRDYQATDLLEANAEAAVLTPGLPLPLEGLPYVTAPGDSLQWIVTRLLVRVGLNDLLASLPGLDEQVTAVLAGIPVRDPADPVGPATVLDPARTVNLPGGMTYTTVTGDTATLIAACLLARATGQIDLPGYIGALRAVPGNQWLPADVAAPLPEGRTVWLAPLVRPLQPGDTIASLASTLMTTREAIGAALTSLEPAVPVLAPGAALHVPLTYRVRANDTLSSVAAAFNVPLDHLAERVAGTPGLFKADARIVIADVPAIRSPALMTGLLNCGAWNTAAGQVSRFLLSGIRLPDPADATLRALTTEQLRDPARLPDIRTRPVFDLTGQQYPGAEAVVYGANYMITLARNAGARWLDPGGAGADPVMFGLTDGQRTMLTQIAGTPLEPGIEDVSRLPLFQLAPPRVVLQTHLAWQAASVPPSLGTAAAAGNPSVWMFPDALVSELEQAAARALAPSPHQLVMARHLQADQPAVTAEVPRYAWATLVNLTLSLPLAADATPSAAGSYIVDGADDTGAALLWRLQDHLTRGDGADLYLLYPPDPASPNSSGLASDPLDSARTCLLKANLSTLTHPRPVPRAVPHGEREPRESYAAALSEPAGFLTLLWEASITRSGGFYLRYVRADGTPGLPPSVFGTAASAQVCLLVMLRSQASGPPAGPGDAPQAGQPGARPAGLLPFSNCAVIGDNIDPAASLFVQPATVTVGRSDTLQSIASAFAKRHGGTLSAGDLATANAGVRLRPGAVISIPGRGEHVIARDDTFGSVAALLSARVPTTAADIGTACADAGILEPGAQLQFAPGTLRSTAIVPPGMTGFQVTRANPDRGRSFGELTPAEIVSSLFNLVGWRISGGAAFRASGGGLATTTTMKPLTDAADGMWHYQQTLAIAPFGRSSQPAASPALPPATANPYNGIAGSGEARGQVTIALTLRDVYGNDWPMPDGGKLEIPVGYYDRLTGPGAWPSLALSYRVTGPPAAVVVEASMHQDRYVPSGNVPVPSALAAIAADLRAYTGIWYQVSQPDVSFTLATTLAQHPDGTPVSQPVAKAPLYELASGAYVYLSALATMRPVRVEVAEGGAPAAAIADRYGVSVPELFAANQARPCTALFGDARLSVPLAYAVQQADTIASIIAKAARGGIIARAAVRLTVERLAELNADVGLNPGVVLVVGNQRVTASRGDTLHSVANRAGTGTDAVASANDKVPGLFAPTTTLVIGTKNDDPPALRPGETLAEYAVACVLPLYRLAEANAGIRFAAGAVVDIPGVLENTSDAQHCVYRAPEGATADAIAALFGITAAALGVLNPLPPGPDGLWICPPMRGDAHGQNDGHGQYPACSLAGLAAAYNTDPVTLALANAATPGVLAEGVSLTVSGKTYATRKFETFNSLARRFAALGVSVTVAGLAAAAGQVPGLIEPAARIAPVPPPALGIRVPVTPGWSQAVFPVITTLTQSRDRSLVHQDFAGADDVSTSTASLPPDPGQQADDASLSLTRFAETLEAALPGLHLAIGSPLAEGDDPATMSTLWAVSLADSSPGGGDARPGPAISYSFVPAKAAYFALPPLSPALAGGEVEISPYVTGQQPPLSGPARKVSFRSVDLDGWLEAFLGAADLFSSPAYAGPAHSLSPGSVDAVLAAKQRLAGLLSARVAPVLDGTPGDARAAGEALYQAMLMKLSSAYTVDTVIQVPVKVKVTGPLTPGNEPRLAGSAVSVRSAAGGDRAYSLSTAKVGLAAGESSATFLFSVKAAPEHRSVSLDLSYFVTELEVPAPGEKVGGYQGSRWLTFVRPASLPPGNMRGLVVPVPLRAYPSPVTLLSQQASQAVARPAAAADLSRWDLSFSYAHEDAEQDTPIVEVALNTAPARGPLFTTPSDPLQHNVFAALARFTSAWPALKNDLAVLTALPPGHGPPEAAAAVDAFAKLARDVADAFLPTALGPRTQLPPPQILRYRLQKELTAAADETATLRSLTVTSMPQPNAAPLAPGQLEPQVPLWPPKVVARWDDHDHQLGLIRSDADAAVFGYPPGVIQARAPLTHRMTFRWPGDPDRPPSEPDVPAKPAGAQNVEFLGLNVLRQQNARAGVSVWRNLELVEGQATNPAFVYRTPVAGFASNAFPSVVGAEPIVIGQPGNRIAESLGRFLGQLIPPGWVPEGQKVTIRLAISMSRVIASTGDRALRAVVPMFLIAAYEFDPKTDADWTRDDSLVARADNYIAGWCYEQGAQPSGATFLFDLTVYGGGEHPQPLIQDVTLSAPA